MTSTDLTVLNPITGELVALDAPTDELARAMAEIRELEWQLRYAKRSMADEVLRRMDLEAKWTARVGDYEVKGDGPGGLEFDAEALYEDLSKLASEGVISWDAVAEAVEPVTAYKVKVRGVNALRKLPLVAETVERHQRPAEKPRQVSVKPVRR